MSRTNGLWLIVGLIGYCLFPWYSLDDPFWSFEWMGSYPDADTAPALLQVATYGKLYLLPPLIAFGLIGLLLLLSINVVAKARAMGAIALAGLLLTAIQGLSIVRDGPRAFSAIFEPLGGASGQIGFGAGAR